MTTPASPPPEPPAEKLIERLEGTVRTITRPLITLILVLVACWATIAVVKRGEGVPEWFIAMATGAVGMWFGSRQNGSK